MNPKTLHLLATALLISAAAQAQQPTATGANQLVNVATSAFGAKGLGAGQNLVQGEEGKLASTGAAQPAFTVINLAGEIEMSKVSLEVGNQKGKLKVVALKDDGTPDLKSGRVVTEFTLDGSTSTVSADVSGVKVQRVAIVWEPESPGQPLSLTKVGLFTSKPEAITSLPEVKAIMQAAPAPAVATASTSAAATAAPAPAATSSAAAATPASTGNSGAAGAGTGTSSAAAGAGAAATPTSPGSTTAAPVQPLSTPATSNVTAAPPVTSPNSTAAGAAATPASPGRTTAAPVQPLSTPAASNVTAAAPVPPQTRNVSR